MLNLEIALYFENYMVHQKRGYLWGMWLRNQSRSSLMAKISARADHFPIGKYSTYMLVRTIRVVRKEELPIGSRTRSRLYTLSQSSVFKGNTIDVLFYERNGLQGWIKRRY